MPQRETTPSLAPPESLQIRFCRDCGAENSPGLPRCTNCAASLEGADQAAHDARMRAERHARVRAAQEAELRATAVEKESRRAQTIAAQEAAVADEEARARGARVRAQLAVTVVVVCLIAVLTATLHLVLAPSVYVIRWGALLGLLVSVGATLAIFRRIKDSIDGF